MSNTRITARINDQTLQLVNLPLLSSGSVDVVQIACSFDPLWDGYAKSAVFFKAEERKPKVYHIPLVADVATVPHEVLDEEGDVFFGVMGVAENTRTTEAVRLAVVQGAITTATAEHEDPAPDIYKELLAAYGVQDARINELVAMRGTAGATIYPLEGEYIADGSILTNGISAAVSLTIDGLTLIGYGDHSTDGNILPEVAPLFPEGQDIILQCDNADLDVVIKKGSSDGDWPYLWIRNKTNASTGIYGTKCWGFYDLAAPTIHEVADARVAANGKTWDTLGDHLRDRLRAYRRRRLFEFPQRRRDRRKARFWFQI